MTPSLASMEIKRVIKEADSFAEGNAVMATGLAREIPAADTNPAPSRGKG